MSFLIGFLAGIIVVTVVFIFMMRRYMLVYYKIPGGDFNAVNEAVKKTIPQFKGWSFPIPSWKFYQSQISKGFKYDNIKNMEIHFVCKPAHANKMLRIRPEFGGMMPCSWAVFETTNGDVYIAKMNIKLMSKMFSGTIKEIMVDVAKTEEKMFDKIKKEVSNG